MKTDILLDVGGTGIKGCGVQGGRSGPIREFDAEADAPKEALLRHFADIIQALACGGPLRRIAMAFPGPFDYDRGIPLMRGLAKYESLWGISLPESLEGLDIHAEKWYFINDVSAYALGVSEQLDESARGMTVCLGTGAGSAFLLDGRLCTDPAEGIPEHGWIYALPYAGSIVDDYLSDRGIRCLSREYLGRELSPKALNGDEPGGGAVWAAFGHHLAAALAPVLRSFRPTDLVLGGKITLAWPRFGAELQAVCAQSGIQVHTEPDTSRWAIRGLRKIAER